jgi:hypothetical protein
VNNDLPLAWLLDEDAHNPGVRYFALRDLLHRPDGAPEVAAAQAAVMRSGPIPVILEAQYPEGYWVKPGPGYSPKYRATVWQLLFLAQLGAVGQVQHDERVRRAVEYVLIHHRATNGALSYNGQPAGALHCLWGNLTRALFDLGAASDGRLAQAVDLLARSVTGDGYTAYDRSGIQGPGFCCAYNYGLPCGWGAVRVLWALNRVPTTPVIEAAIGASVDFLLSYDVARADYPYHERISAGWFRFGYPLGYVTDVLLNLEALLEAGCAGDARLEEAVALVRSYQDRTGRWAMMQSYNGRMWTDVEQKGRPSKWVTLRALRTLKMWGEERGES